MGLISTEISALYRTSLIVRRHTEEMFFLLIGIHFLVLVRNAAFLERNPSPLDKWAKLE